MTQKTENLTTEEAWAAMARGECVDTEQAVHRLNGLRLEYWRGEELGWTLTSIIDAGPYSIVPDPSKPKEVEDEYFKDWSEVYSAYEDDGSEICPMRRLRRLIEKHFEKRKP